MSDEEWLDQMSDYLVLVKRIMGKLHAGEELSTVERVTVRMALIGHFMDMLGTEAPSTSPDK